jgi:hypothetical protein
MYKTVSVGEYVGIVLFFFEISLWFLLVEVTKENAR